MTTFLSLHDAIAEYVHDGTSVAMEGFTHLIPFAAGHQIIRQQKREMCLILPIRTLQYFYIGRLDANVEAPVGALPSYTHGYYRRDNAFFSAWDGISRNREMFLNWMQEHVVAGHL